MQRQIASLLAIMMPRQYSPTGPRRMKPVNASEIQKAELTTINITNNKATGPLRNIISKISSMNGLFSPQQGSIASRSSSPGFIGRPAAL